ncbi:MAG: hypothetical protein HUU35_18925, partial [Armatimonadetes bacterium]|nr:hypothetical protein [Armatimonadota bacterium]
MRVRRWCCALLLACVSGAGAVDDRPAKKLLEYGWDVPYPSDVRANIRGMEKRPFDGVLLRLRGFNHAFDPRPWKRPELQPQLDDLAAIDWQRFTDNFLVLYAANDQGMDWFNDAQWEVIVANLALEAEAARAGRCVGICFDPEPYGNNPWPYTEALKSRPFWQVEQQVRRRGAQFVRALQTTMPDLKLLTFFQLSLFGHLFDQPDPSKRSEVLSSHSYALLPAFLNGMLDAAAPGVRIIDGNENSYYYTSETNFLAAYHAIKDSARSLIAPENRPRYVAQVQAGVALYIDQLVALRERQILSHYLSAEDRLRYAEHNTYWALKTTDEYVWCYSEKMNWWQDQVPAGLEEALRSARAKYAAGQPLGFTMTDLVKRGEEAREAAIAAKLQKRTAAMAAL